MLSWFVNNVGSVIAILILAVIITAIILKMVYDKKRGKSSCGCNCGCCAMKENCQGNHMDAKK